MPQRSKSKSLSKSPAKRKAAGSKKVSERTRAINNLCRKLEQRGILDPNRGCGTVVKGKKKYTEQDLYVAAADADLRISNTGRVSRSPTRRTSAKEQPRSLFDIPGVALAMSEPARPIPAPAPKVKEAPMPALSSVIEPTAPSEPAFIPEPPPFVPEPPPFTLEPPSFTLEPPPQPKFIPGPPPMPQPSKGPPAAPKLPPPVTEQMRKLKTPPKMSMFEELTKKKPALKTTADVPKQPPKAQAQGGFLGELAARLKQPTKLKSVEEQQKEKSTQEAREKAESLFAQPSKAGELTQITKRQAALAPERLLKRQYSAGTVDNQCSEKKDEDSCEEASCNWEEGDDWEGGDVCKAYGEPEWLTNPTYVTELQDTYDKLVYEGIAEDNAQEWVEQAERELGGVSHIWREEFLTDGKSTPLTDAKLADIAIWDLWEKRDVSDKKMKALRRALKAYKEKTWSFPLFIDKILTKVDAEYNWYSCIDYADCSSQILYRLFSYIVLESLENELKADKAKMEKQLEKGKNTLAAEIGKEQAIEKTASMIAQTAELQQLQRDLEKVEEEIVMNLIPLKEWQDKLSRAEDATAKLEATQNLSIFQTNAQSLEASKQAIEQKMAFILANPVVVK